MKRQKPQLNRGSDQSSRISQVLAGHKFKFVTQLVSDLGEWKKLKLKICAVRGYDNNKAPTKHLSCRHLPFAPSPFVYVCECPSCAYVCNIVVWIFVWHSLVYLLALQLPKDQKDLAARTRTQFVCTPPPPRGAETGAGPEDQRTTGRKDYRTSVSLPSYTNKLISARHSKCLEHSAMFVIEYHAGGQDEISLPKRQPVGQIMQN